MSLSAKKIVKTLFLTLSLTVTFLAASLFYFTPAFAAPSLEETPLYIKADDPEYESFKPLLSKFLTQPSQKSAPRDQKCEKAYSDLYDKDTLTVSVYWGYNNTDNGIADDPHFKKIFIEMITGPCLPGLSVCGFKKVADQDPQNDPRIGAESFEKIIANPSQNRAKHPTVKVRLKLANAALTSIQINNESTLWREQYYRSVAIEKAYLKSLGEDDVVLYSGHARYGTGIGFRPFATGSGPWIRSWILQPMKYSVQQTLQKAETPAKILGFLSCDSDAHYGRALHESSPTSALLLSRSPLAIRDTQTVLFASMNSILQGQCEEQLQTSLRVATRTFYWFADEPEPMDLVALSPKLYNFFQDDTDEIRPRKPLRDGFRTESQKRVPFKLEGSALH